MNVNFTGEITKIIFQKDDFMIGMLKQNDGTDVRFAGNIIGVANGEKLTIKGKWFNHHKYGKQVNVSSWERPIPKGKEQVIKFLSSGLIKGCGEKRAIDIAEKLGENAIDIIHAEGEKALLDIKGIGISTAQKIVKSIREAFEVQKIVSDLLTYGISADVSFKLYKEYGTFTVEKIKNNPYLLTQIAGVGFLKSDKIARKMGLSATSGYRLHAGINYVINNLCYQRGYCYVDKAQVVKKVLKVLNYGVYDNRYLVLKNDILTSLYNMEDKDIVIEKDKIYPKHLFEYEQGLAQKLSLIRESREGEAMPFLDKEIRSYQKKQSIVLAEQQKQAIYKLFQENLLVLTGGPGTGKTTIIKAMIDIFKKRNPRAKIKLSAPTGRASRKLAEATRYNAQTLHSMIGYVQGEMPKYNESNKLDVDLLVIDEMSMVDIQIAYWVFNALPNRTKVIFVGDVDQLPSVGPGNVLQDIISSGVATVKLKEIFRQDEESQIVINAHRINSGKSLLIDSEKDDFYFIEQNNIQHINNLILLSAKRFIELGYDLSDLLVLSPMRKGIVGTEYLNEQLRQLLNPKDPYKREIALNKRFFREGDKVLHNTNNREKNIFNGELGYVKKITKEKNEEGKLIDVMICDYDGHKVKYYRNDMHEVELGYALTIHKSQGGEAPIVIMPVTMTHKIMLARNLYYTGITRAKKRVVLIGELEAMDLAIENNKISLRNTLLDDRIIAYNKYLKRYENRNNVNTSS